VSGVALHLAVEGMFNSTNY